MAEQPKKTPARLTQARINAIAAAATVHPRTVVKALDGKRIRGDAGVRLDQELERQGLLR
jgi:hypothetical protein